MTEKDTDPQRPDTDARDGSGTRTSFKRNLFWNYFSGLVSVLSLVIFYPIGVGLSSPSSYGLWVLVFGATQLLSASDFGLGDGVVRSLTQLISSGKPADTVQKFVTVALSMFASMAAVVIVTYAIALPLYLRAVPLDQLTSTEIRYAVGAGGVALSAAVGVRAANAILWSLDRQDIERKSTAVAVALRALAYVVVWMTDSGFIGVITADVLASLLPLIVCLHAVRARFGPASFSREAFAEYARPLLGLSGTLFIGSLASMLVLQLPLYIVGAALGLTAATAFGALMRVYQSCRLVNSWMANPFIHGISTGQGPALKRAAVGAHLLTGTIGLGIAIILAGLGRSFMVAWMGPAFAFAGTAMAVISLGAIGDALTQPSRLVINLRGRPLWTAALSVVTLLAVLAGTAVAARTGDLLLVMIAVAGIPFAMTPFYLLVASGVVGTGPLPIRRHPFFSALVVLTSAALVLCLHALSELLTPWPAVLLGGAVVGAVLLLTLKRLWPTVHGDQPAA